MRLKSYTKGGQRQKNHQHSERLTEELFRATAEEELARSTEGNCRLNVSGVLRFLGVSRSGYHSFKKWESQKQFDSIKTTTTWKEMILLMIFSFWMESKMIFGAPKITQEFHKLGIPLAQKTVSKYMKELGIKACYIRPYVRTTIDPDFDESLQNLLREQFNPEQPNAVWCPD